MNPKHTSVLAGYISHSGLVLPIVSLALLAALGWCQTAGAQNIGIDDVRVEVESAERVLISFDLPEPPSKGASYVVEARISTAGTGRPIPLRSVTGDVGKNVLPGAGRTIVWNAAADFPNGLDAEVRILIHASVTGGKSSKSLVYIVGGALVAGGGVTAALLLGGSPGTDILGDPVDTALPAPPQRPGGN